MISYVARKPPFSRGGVVLLHVHVRVDIRQALAFTLPSKVYQLYATRMLCQIICEEAAPHALMHTDVQT